MERVLTKRKWVPQRLWKHRFVCRQPTKSNLNSKCKMSRTVPIPGQHLQPLRSSQPTLSAFPLLQLSNIRSSPRTAATGPLKRRRSASSTSTATSSDHPTEWDQYITVPADNMPPLRSLSRHSSSSPVSHSDHRNRDHHVIDCSGKNACKLPSRPMKQKCTDQCVVVQCPDAGSFPEICTQEDCHVEPCDGGDNCEGGFEDFVCSLFSFLRPFYSHFLFFLSFLLF